MADFIINELEPGYFVVMLRDPEGKTLLRSDIFYSEEECRQKVSQYIEAFTYANQIKLVQNQLDGSYLYKLYDSSGDIILIGESYKTARERDEAVNYLLNTVYRKEERFFYKSISQFVKERKKQLGLTQHELAQKAGVGLRFVRELEQGKITLKVDKVNQVLNLFGYELGAVPVKRNTITDEKSSDQNAE